MSGARVKPGDLLAGKYRVEKVLGAGGMGMVVAARHVELGQRVALKFMLREAMKEPGLAERFSREARAAVQLKSPHTARVLDVGRLKNGEPFMVMEYLDGQDLDEMLRARGPVAPQVAVDLVLQACEAFAEAHGLGMIHRDIKLKNLFLTSTVDGRPFVKVLDFGLAKQLGGNGGDVSLTATTAVFGSPQYMSPEQMRSAKDADARSDIWSLGVCLYELLTGRVPFDAAGVAEICAMVLKDPVVPPSRWAPAIPPELEAVVLKCLEKDPLARYQTVVELGYALEPWSASEGSARRILHVMEAAQRTEVPTLVHGDAAGAIDDQAKTMSAWDSGDRARTKKLAPAVMAGAIAVMVVFGLVGAGAIVLARSQSRVSSLSSAAVGAPSGPEAVSATPVPVPAALAPDTTTTTTTTALPGAATAPPAATEPPIASAGSTSAHRVTTAPPPPAKTTARTATPTAPSPATTKPASTARPATTPRPGLDGL
jgi:serine/threonine-protein kinase